MQSNSRNFYFSMNFDFSNDNVFIVQNQDEGKPFPPVTGIFQLLDGTHFHLLDGTDFLLL